MDKSYKRILFPAEVKDNEDPWVLGRIRAYPVDQTIRAALEAFGFDEKTGLTEQEKKQGYIRLDENANPIKKSSAEPVKPAATAMPNETDAETAKRDERAKEEVGGTHERTTQAARG